MMDRIDIEVMKCINVSDLTGFIVEKSGQSWNQVVDLEKKFGLFDNNRDFYYIYYDAVSDLTVDKFLIQQMINLFFEEYNLDKNEGLYILFTD